MFEKLRYIYAVYMVLCVCLVSVRLASGWACTNQIVLVALFRISTPVNPDGNHQAVTFWLLCAYKLSMYAVFAELYKILCMLLVKLVSAGNRYASIEQISLNQIFSSVCWKSIERARIICFGHYTYLCMFEFLRNCAVVFSFECWVFGLSSCLCKLWKSVVQARRMSSGAIPIY